MSNKKKEIEHEREKMMKERMDLARERVKATSGRVDAVMDDIRSKKENKNSNETNIQLSSYSGKAFVPTFEPAVERQLTTKLHRYLAGMKQVIH